MSLSVLLVLGLFGAYLMYRGQQRAAEQRDVDATTLRELASAGSDLARPHEVEFYLYFPAEDRARRVADSLRQEGFAVTLERTEVAGEWLCLATREMVPVLGELHAFRDRFTTLAAASDGAYDGWGATVVERGAEATGA